MQLLTKFQAIVDTKVESSTKIVASAPSAVTKIPSINLETVSELLGEKMIRDPILFAASDLRGAHKVRFVEALAAISYRL